MKPPHVVPVLTFCLESNHKGATIRLGRGGHSAAFCLESNHKGATMEIPLTDDEISFALNLITRVLQ